MVSPTSIAIDACVSLASSACIAAVLGVDLQAVLWAFFGAVVGLVLAPGSSFLKAVGVFVFATLMCALGGTAIAHAWNADDSIWRNTWAALLAVGFHPLTATVVNELPPMVKVVFGVVARKFGARND